MSNKWRGAIRSSQKHINSRLHISGPSIGGKNLGFPSPSPSPTLKKKKLSSPAKNAEQQNGKERKWWIYEGKLEKIEVFAKISDVWRGAIRAFKKHIYSRLRISDPSIGGQSRSQPETLELPASPHHSVSGASTVPEASKPTETHKNSTSLYSSSARKKAKHH